MNSWHIVYQILRQPFTIVISMILITPTNAKHQMVLEIAEETAVEVVTMKTNFNVAEVIQIDSSFWHKVAQDRVVAPSHIILISTIAAMDQWKIWELVMPTSLTWMKKDLDSNFNSFRMASKRRSKKNFCNYFISFFLQIKTFQIFFSFGFKISGPKAWPTAGEIEHFLSVYSGWWRLLSSNFVVNDVLDRWYSINKKEKYNSGKTHFQTLQNRHNRIIFIIQFRVNEISALKKSCSRESSWTKIVRLTINIPCEKGVEWVKTTKNENWDSILDLRFWICYNQINKTDDRKHHMLVKRY